MQWTNKKTIVECSMTDKGAYFLIKLSGHKANALFWLNITIPTWILTRISDLQLREVIHYTTKHTASDNFKYYELKSFFCLKNLAQYNISILFPFIHQFDLPR